MIEDPIVEFYRAVGNEYARSFDFDLDAMVEDLRRRENEHPDQVVSLVDEGSPTPASSDPGSCLAGNS